MHIALLLIDLQNHFLATPGLQPPIHALVDEVSAVLADFRRHHAPVVHLRTTIHQAEDALPHWRALPAIPCLVGTPGHGSPAALEPWEGEPIFHKSGFNAFQGGELEGYLRNLGVTCVVVAGVYLRTCVHVAALEAHQRGFRVLLAHGAVGDDDPLHAEVNRRWLEKRGMTALHRSGLEVLLSASCSQSLPDAGSVGRSGVPHASPLDPGKPLWDVECTSPGRMDRTLRAAQVAGQEWRACSAEERSQIVIRFRQCLERKAAVLAKQIVVDTGKPIQYAHDEIHFALNLIDAAIHRHRQDELVEQGEGWSCLHRHHGLVAAITPWNNPLAIPIGKLVPALLYGNTVVWKPAIAGTALARRCLELLQVAELPPGCVGLIEGGAPEALALMEHPAVDAITITGSAEAGMAAQVAAARRRIPLQAELGGNNAAIVWHDTDLRRAAAEIVAGAFACAGQRCTANRRAIVAAEVAQPFHQELLAAIEALPWGDPLDHTTVMGPVISVAAVQRLNALLERARRAGCRVHRRSDLRDLRRRSPCYVPPTLIEAKDPEAEWVQQESFGPLLVLQVASSWQEALELCNGVRQGLAASLFSSSALRQQEFLEKARAGILKINATTAGVAADAPFGGWGESGIGAPEHGVCDLAFYTRLQTVYSDSWTNLQC